MKISFIFAFTIFLILSNYQPTVNNFGLPKLHVMNRVVLSPTYSCRPPEELNRGYENTALFLSAYSKRRNSYDLLFNGGCRSEDTFDVPDMSLIADLGESQYLDEISAHLAFNLQSKAETFSKFQRQIKVQFGHTYAVMINDGEKRGLFLFTVVNHSQNKQVEIKYVVRSYQVIKVVEESPGFEWAKKGA